MPLSVLVTGGTGRLGRLVVRRLRDAGCDVRVLTRRSREATDGIRYLTGDLRTGEGVAAAVDGTAAIVHCRCRPASWSNRSTPTKWRPGWSS